MKDRPLSGKLVVLTGAGGIIGRVAAERFVRGGARLVMVDRCERALGAARDALQEDKAAAFAMPCDLTDPIQVAELAASVEARHGPVDALFNNVAGKSKNIFAPFEHFPLDEWNEVMATNLTTAMLCCQHFGSLMAARGRGTIVNTLSIYGIVAPDQRIYEGAEYEGRAINSPAVYSAAKAGLWGLTKYLATYWGSKGVRVNAVTPGGVFSGQNETFVGRYSARVPMGRMAKAEEIADAMLFLASDGASYINGQNIVVDGGLTAW
ncbi:SDR family oxidoreductase [Sphingopyxis sp. FD7]|jgi:NAD(P)-dependent dehydrogenase (short-subunit alcohol dehydrogenase family)|uniref:SDR family oxidoreductase n=1 Tax=Sphingopyxis sp. FD7 TaxID=1914525 RepID=UPI000DC6196A|nr:SDR family oxidoreductase [Sphingopyxis sp. FD7]BBB12196.1 short-chain dehydrogenase [Sphingopyxis sp. FD7]